MAQISQEFSAALHCLKFHYLNYYKQLQEQTEEPENIAWDSCGGFATSAACCVVQTGTGVVEIKRVEGWGLGALNEGSKRAAFTLAGIEREHCASLHRFR